MTWAERLGRRLRVLLRKDEVERELDEEVRLHVEMETEDLVRGGMEPARARREALRRFGGVERTKERVRDARGGRLLEDLLRDLRQGARSLGKSPAFTASALLVLALGIGSATAFFGVVDAVLLEPLPYPASERLVRVWPAAPERDVDRGAFSYADFRDWRERARTLSGLAVYSTLPADYPYLGGETPEELATAWVAGDFFELLGVAPALGRTLRPEDAEVGRQAVVLSRGAWERLYGADPSVVGRSITLDYRTFEVVGVMPAGFAFPEDGGGVDIWVPLTVIPEDDIPIQIRGVRFLQAVGRLAPGATPETAREDLGRVARELEETHPDANAGVSAATVVPLRDWMVGDVEAALWIVLGAVGFILLLASANVANLLLARGTARSREVALRMSLGASTGRVTRQLLTESLLLGVLGGALGVVLAWAAQAAVVARSAGLLPRAAEIDVDASVLGVSVLVTLAAGALAGVLPAIRTAAVAPGDGLGVGARGVVGAGRPAVRLRRALVAAEVAVAVVLLTGAGLVARSLGALGRVDPGFRSEGRIAMTLTISDQKHPERADWMALYHGILESLEAHPDVLDAGAIRYLPYRGEGEAAGVRVPGLYEPAPEAQRYARMFQVSEGTFEAMGIELLRGRPIRRTDGPEDPMVAVVNEAFQRDFFQRQDPLGRRFSVGRRELEVVGVVTDVRHDGLDEEGPPTVYVSNDQVPRIQMSYVARTAGDPLALAGDMRRIVRELDPDQTIAEIVPLSTLDAEALARPRFFTLLLGGFAFLALVLAALGVYGVLAYVVRSRTREMGLRLALGARPARLAGRVLAQGMIPVAAGLGVGFAGAAGLSRFVGALLFGVEPVDPLTYAVVAAVLSGAALAACLGPAWWAGRVDPMESLRME